MEETQRHADGPGPFSGGEPREGTGWRGIRGGGNYLRGTTRLRSRAYLLPDIHKRHGRHAYSLTLHQQVN